MKAMIVLIVSLMSTTAMADLGMYCWKGDVEECAERILEAMDTMSCEVEDMVCGELERDGLKSDVVACDVVTPNCTSPTSDLFGFYGSSVYCWDRSDEFVNLKTIDRSLTLDWSFGFIRKHVHHVCVK